jgi:HD superfamily phosphohydrolase
MHISAGLLHDLAHGPFWFKFEHEFMLTDGEQTGKRCSVTRTRIMRNVQFKPMVEFHYVKIRKARYVLPVEKMRGLKKALTCEFADCRPRADSAMGHDLSDDEAEAAKLLAEADEELREQRAEEQMNLYTSVDSSVIS